MSAFPEVPEVELDEIKTYCQCIPFRHKTEIVEEDGTNYYSDGQIFFDDSAFGLGKRCVKCGHKPKERK